MTYRPYVQCIVNGNCDYISSLPVVSVVFRRGSSAQTILIFKGFSGYHARLAI